MRVNRPGAHAIVAALLLLGGAARAEAQETAAPPAPSDARPGSVHTGDFTLEAGETAADVVVVGGDLRVLGTITGDAVVVGGELILEESGSVEGDATVTGGSIIENGGRVRGEMRMLDAGGEDVQAAVERAVAGRAAAGADEARRAAEDRDRDRDGWEARGGGGSSWFRSIRNGFFGLISTFALAVVLAGIGAVLTFYGRPYLDTVSDTIRGATVRSGAVGLAASFLVIPAFVVLIVALAVSIIGIPFLLVAIPIYPLAVAAAAGLGLLAAAHAIGERTSEQRSQGFDFRYRNSYAYLFSGLAMLMAPLLAAHLIEMTGFLSFIGILLKIVTWVVIWAATTVGFGAVILSRAGTQRTFVPRPPDPGFDPDPAFDSEPYASGPHV